MNITYRQFETSDEETIAELMMAFASEDSEVKPSSAEKIRKTFDELSNHPDKGTILVILDSDEIIGYGILINFWSNEYGGNILDIDELYIKPTHRGNEIGTKFIKYLIDNKFNNSIALQLGTLPSNNRARQLYERIGFKLSQNSYFEYDLEE